MERLTPRRLRCGAFLLAFLIAGQASAGKIERRFLRQTVMITVTGRDQSVERGAGVVLCQEGGRAYVLTAHNLLAGKTAGGRKVLRRPARTEIRFYDDGIPQIVDERASGKSVITFHVPGEDVVLLSFPLLPDLRSTAETLTLRTLFHTAGEDKQEVVFAVGYRVSSGEAWAGEWGTLRSGRGKFLHHSAQLVEGFSGGPLFTKKGALIGINLQPVAGDQIGADADALYGEAVAVLQILPAIGEWLPASCLRRMAIKAEPALTPQGRDDEPAAQGHGVTLYRHASFQGRGETFHGDDANLRDNPIGNDQASSVSVPPGCTVTLYQDADYLGPATILRTDNPDLGTTPVGNDAVSSLKVSCDPRPPPDSVRAAVSDEPGRKEPTGDQEELKEHAVMITVTHEDQSVEHGAGVVLCQEDGRAYVLTARHVLAGKRPEGAKKLLHHSGRTEIHFFHQDLPSVVDDRTAGESGMTFHEVPEEDLVLLSFPFSRELESTAFLGPPASRTAGGGGDEGFVLAVGFREPWAAERGRLLPGDGKTLHHTAPIVEGFSGGPLFYPSGALAGINLERVAGEAIGAEACGFFGEARSMEQILPRIDRWLPAGCLRARERRITGLLQAGAEESLTAVPQVLLAEAHELKVERDTDSVGRFRFGPYRITRAHRGPMISGLSPFKSQSKQKFEFTFDESDGTIWEGWCTQRVEKKRDYSKLLAIALKHELSHQALSCTLKQQGGEKTVELVMNKHSDPEKETAGVVTAGAVDIRIAGSRPATAKRLRFVIETGYLFYIDDRIIGAIQTFGDETGWRHLPVAVARETFGEETVWLHPSVTGEARSTFLVAAAALLLPSGFNPSVE